MRFRRPGRADVRAAARKHFGWKTLRAGQEEAVRALLAGRDTLVVMPTGAGKSAVYQLAGLLIDGPTVVISPLISLQRDQLAGLARHGDAGLEGVAVNSAQPAAATEQAWSSLTTGEAEFVFLAPEQLANETVVERLATAGVSLLVVDEAHCVSAWGHDFRPDYLRIADVLERLGRPTVVALTATASPPVREEIVDRLRMREPELVVQGFDRPNLHLGVQRFTQARHKEDAVLDQAAALTSELGGSGIVYTATRKGTERYAAALVERGVPAAAYHGGMAAAEREQVHHGFLDSSVRVVVATSAFGMGIDKPDVRFVLHADIAESLDSYYQEIGRAGRDGQPARAVLLYRSEDVGLRSFFASGGPDLDTITQVADAVRAHRGATPGELKEELSLTHTRLTHAVNLLEQAGALAFDGAGHLTYTDPSVPTAAAVAAAGQVAGSHEAVDRSRVEMMRGYAETSGCRRQFLLGYFGETLPGPCGNCDVCEERVVDVRDAVVDGPYALNDRVVHREWGPGVVMRPEPDRVTVLFESVGYRTLALAALEADHGLLATEP
ncbi:RecQ family ATP-dependent DNA helicase [Spongisporangium articulatum]|uniref:ATP-dependent DNA helicase RecQ n=1 Tax=Spongisporangium articulatum TaxID=3362603 RepID=A0ABW8AH99_9ACTN